MDQGFQMAERTSNFNNNTHYKTFTLSTLALSSENVLHRPTFSHLSPNSSMVRASHRRSEDCGFESRLGTQKFF